MNNTDSEYFRLLNLILEKGRWKSNRTGTRTLGVFGAQARFNLSEGFPLLTTKKVHYKAIIHELLWFIRGDTNIKYLVDNDVHIWDGDCYRVYKNQTVDKIGYDGLMADDNGRGVRHYTKDEFIARIKSDEKFAAKWGDLGQGTYGQMWRAFPYHTEETHLSVDLASGKVDQLQKVIDTLKTNPDSRRIIVNAWHPYWVDHCALPPCHCLFNFNTEELTVKERVDYFVKDFNKKKREYENSLTPEDFRKSFYGRFDGSLPVWTCEEELVKWLDGVDIPKRRLNCLLYQRSCDTFLGIPFNISSYSLLTMMIAKSVNMLPGEFIHTYGDLHLYENHIEQAKLQLTREPRALPTLWLNPEVKSIFDYKFDDIRIDGYDPHPAIKGEVSTG